MKTIGRIGFTIILLMASSTVYSQKDYQKGFVITHSGDTIQGQIDLNSNRSHGKTCHFLKDGDSKPTAYTANDIFGYKIENSKYYVSKQIELDGVRKSVFLEYLIDGIVDLFYLSEQKEEYYYIEKDGVLSRLSNEQKERTDSQGDTYFEESNQYKGALIYLFQDSPKLTKDIQTTRFSDKPLIDLTKEYHYAMCKEGEVCIDYTKSTKRSYFFEPFVGFSVSKMGVKTSNDFAHDSRPYGGFYIRFIPVKSNRLLNLKLGVNFTKYYFQADFEHDLDDRVSRTYRTNLKYSSINVPIVIEYTFPSDKWQPSVFIGFDNIFIYNSDQEVLHVSNYFGQTGNDVIVGEIFSEFRKYEIGFLAGVGLRYNMNPNSYLLLSGNFEHRIPSTNAAGYFLEYHFVESLSVNIGYGIKL